MDQHKLRTLVFEKTGVRIDVDDPVFALVALNEAVLEEAVERHIARIDQASALAAAAISGRPVAPAAATPTLPRQQVAQEKRIMALAAGAAALGAVLVLLGQAVFFRPAPAPAPQVIAKELSGEQALALKNAEKLDKIISRLDSKTRNTIQSEMQKP
jgi:hypothetical protein